MRIVHGLLLARVPRVDVDDLVQEVLTAMRRLDSLRDPAAFQGSPRSPATTLPTTLARNIGRLEL